MSSPLLEQLIEALRVLPGVGPKSAQRMAYHVLERDRDGGRRLAAALASGIERSQWPMRSIPEANAAASRRPPSRSRSSTW